MPTVAEASPSHPKFRAWYSNKIRKVILIDFVNEIVRLDVDLVEDLDVEFKWVKLMQSTGLHDKNGIEIFEGDIILWEGYSRRYQCERCGNVAEGNSIFQICWDNKTASFHHTKSLESYSITQKDMDEVVVIGNIHQHPHLLSEAQE